MPAYFSLTFELNKSRNAVGAFCETLVHSGPVFKSGYWGFENDSFAGIIAWNQKKLDEDFELGYTEHHSYDYKQMLFDYADFSEVRLFIMNQRRKPVFSFALIVPEYDFHGVFVLKPGSTKFFCGVLTALWFSLLLLLT